MPLTEQDTVRPNSRDKSSPEAALNGPARGIANTRTGGRHTSSKITSTIGAVATSSSTDD